MTASPARGSFDLAWQLNERYAYRLEAQSSVELGKGVKAFDFTLRGMLRIAPARVAADGITLYATIANPTIESRVPNTQRDFDKVAAQIGSTACFVTLSRGVVTEIRLMPGLSTMVGNTYRTALSALQFAQPNSASNEFTAEEYDSTGEYVAAYTWQGGLQWKKEKSRYLGILGATRTPANVPSHVVPEVRASRGDILLAPDGRPQEVAIVDEIDVTGAQAPMHATTSVSLKGMASEAALQPNVDWSALQASMKRFGAEEPLGTEASIESLDAARINGLTFEQAVSGLERIEKEHPGRPVSPQNGAALEPTERAEEEKVVADKSRFFVALAAIFREQPKTVGRAMQQVRAKSPIADTLVEALASSSSPAAQSALVDLMNAKSTAPLERNHIILALSRTPKPSDKSIDAMKSMLSGDPFNDQALLGLGTYARRLRDEGKPEEASAIGQLLVDRLGRASTKTALLSVLQAITNSGYDPALPAVVPFMADEREVIRAAAVRAVQSMQDPQADSLLADHLRTDSSSLVQTSALMAAKVREPSDTLTAAVETVATGASDPHARYRAVQVLVTWRARRPDVRSTLDRVAETDREARIREIAEAAAR